MKWVNAFAAVVIGGSVCASAAVAEEKAAPKSEGALIEAIKAGKPIIDVRYRFELREQANFPEDAYANTVRTRLGYETGEFHHFKVLVEFENVFSIGDDHFNSTTNGKTQFPIIADPDATEVNRAQVTFTGVKNAAVTLGRQRFNLANQRFVGSVDFRQNEQTFDAARLTVQPIKGLSADYAYVSRVHRVFGDDHPLGEFESDSHIMAATYDAKSLGKLTGYGLLLDFENASASSSATWGARYENTLPVSRKAGVKLGMVAEYASQRDYADNPTNYREHYLHGEGALHVKDAALRVGYERLGGTGAAAFQTPLATLHKFQGFADVFLTTPVNGVENLYATASYAWKKAPGGATVNVFATYHDFRAERGGADLGEEIDAGVSVVVKKRWTAEIKGAVYDGVPGFADRSSIWASLRFQY